MSARSCWNTCGTVFHACVSRCAVVRRTPLIGLRSIAPHLLKSGSASPAAAGERASAGARQQAPRIRGDIVHRDAAAGAGALNVLDVHAELAREPARRRRGRNRRGSRVRLRRLCRLRRDRRGGLLGRLHLDDFGFALLRLRRLRLSVLRPSGCFGLRLASAFGRLGSRPAALRSRPSASALRRAPPSRRPSSTTKIVWPTFTFSPGLILTSLTTPAADDGTSIVALSVSSSRTGWSFLIASPGFTITRRTSPPSMFSPSSGNFMSVASCCLVGIVGAWGSWVS